MSDEKLSLRGIPITLSRVTVRYPAQFKAEVPNFPAVQEVSLDVRPGEFLAIIGPSGCGKSTLLKAVAGLVPLAGGEVQFGADQEPRVGFVFQTDALLPWRTAAGNIELAFQLAGDTAGSIRKQAKQLLAEVGLAESADKFPSQLSGGMRKRVTLARALAYDPSIFLMDEPFSALDAQTRIQVGNFFLRILEDSGQTVIFVTHDIEEAVALADRVAVMSRGPGRILKMIDVPLERPRDYYRSRFMTGFNELQEEVWDALGYSHESME